MDAIDIQKTFWEGNFATGVELYHALLGKKLRGGIAYVGGACDSSFGFGVSADILGTFTSLDATVVYDAVVVMHELGHNLGSGHTHDIGSYSPLVDSCVDSSNDCQVFPVPTGSGTIMSYCHLCDGGNSNLAYTFGGYRTAANTWSESTITAVRDFNFQSDRVPAQIYNTISALPSGCTTRTGTVPNQPTLVPGTTAAPTLAPTPAPTTMPTPAPTTMPTPATTPQPTVIVIVTDTKGGKSKASAPKTNVKAKSKGEKSTKSPEIGKSTKSPEIGKSTKSPQNDKSTKAS